MLYCLRFQVPIYVRANLSETNPFLLAQMTVQSIFFQVFILLWMYNFGHPPNSAVTLPHLLLREKSRNFPAQKTVKIESCLLA